MSTTCLCKNRPRATAGATVPGVSAALNAEEVMGQDQVSGAGCHTEDSVLPSAAASQQSVSCWQTAQVSAGGK